MLTPFRSDCPVPLDRFTGVRIAIDFGEGNLQTVSELQDIGQEMK